VKTSGSRISVYAALSAQADPPPDPRVERLRRREKLYFWARVLGILVLGVAGGAALWAGIELLNPGLIGATFGCETAAAALACSLRGRLRCASPLRAIHDLADAMPGITRVERVLTLRDGSDCRLVALGLRSESNMTRHELVVTAERLRRAIRLTQPHVERVVMAVHVER